MKIKINELNPNPFKKEINKGKLNPEQIDKIKSNIKELGLMGSLPVFKKDNKWYLISGHHRLEALRQTYNNGFQVECTAHEYDTEQVLRGMVVENLTQRADELMEVTENLNAVRMFLRKCSPGEHFKENTGVGGRGNEEAGSVRHVHEWINKNGEFMSIGKIQAYLQIHKNLDKRLLQKSKVKTLGGEYEEGISLSEAATLARVEKKDQFKLKNVLDETGLDKDEKKKLVTAFKNADEDVQQKILDKKQSIFDAGYKPQKEEKVLDRAQLSIKFNKRSLELVKEMKFLRKTLYQFRREKLFDQFSPQQKRNFFERLSSVKKEYTELINELETSLEVLK